MDLRGSAEEMQRRTKARTEPCSATKGRPGADLLSALPDELLLHILSFLGIREAVSTSYLSRRWRYLYHNLSSLDFSKGWDDNSARFIDRVLLLHAAPQIELFRLCMSVEVGSTSAFYQIDSWLLFAVRRGVRVLDLDISYNHRDDFWDDGNSYGVPPWVFHCRTLEDFSVDCCRLRLPSHVRLVSLKRLRLTRFEFKHHELECLLLGCPLLQRLELVRCNNEDDLIIDARECRNLEELVIVEELYEEYSIIHAWKVQICAPSVKYLSFHSDDLRRQYEVSDLSSLVVASFQLDVGRALYGDELDAFTTGFMLRIHQVQVLKLCCWSLRALSEKELQGNLVSALPGVTRLELTTGMEEPDLQAILSALLVCSKLRTLVLCIRRHMRTGELDNSGSDGTGSPRSLALNFGIVMQDLKTVVIQGLMRYYNQDPGERGGEAEDFVAQKKENDIVLIGFLLQVSPVLEKLIVKPSKGMDRMTRKLDLLFNLLLDLLSLPRASPNATVIIDGK